MPAYSFQEHFVPFILNGSKTQTIRRRRLKGHAKKGDTVYLYYGLRTRYCRKLKEEKCTDVKTIVISPEGIVLCDRLPDLNRPWMQVIKEKIEQGKAKILSPTQRNKLAWDDGFRPNGNNISGSFNLMLRWWKQTHELPFMGDIIFWKPKTIKHG